MTNDIELLTPTTRAKFLQLVAQAADAGYTLKVLSTIRSCDEQNGLYALGRTAPGNIVTKARGCVSWHVLGRAIDFGFVGIKATEADYQVIGELAEGLGFKWGGRFPGFPDLGHIEWHPGLKIESFCPNPDQCEGAVEQSFAQDEGGGETPPSEGVSESTSHVGPVLLGLGLGGAVMGGLWWWRRPGEGVV
jgi:hypothetical protein